MDGHRIQQYWSHEMETMIETYRQFEILILVLCQDLAQVKMRNLSSS